MHNTVEMVGQKFGRLTVVAREGINRQRMATWRCICDCGSGRVVAGAFLRNGHTKSCGCHKRDVARERLGEDNPVWLGDGVAYHGAHKRIRRARGSASTHSCVDCSGPAEQWSLKAGAGVLAGCNSKGSLMEYSGDPGDYEARCRSCHARHDMAIA